MSKTYYCLTLLGPSSAPARVPQRLTSSRVSAVCVTPDREFVRSPFAESLLSRTVSVFPLEVPFATVSPRTAVLGEMKWETLGFTGNDSILQKLV